jgi:hypothetical protein
VLEDGLKSLAMGGAATTRRRRRDRAWVESHDREDPFAFENVCETLGIDASRLRRRLFGVLDSR